MFDEVIEHTEYTKYLFGSASDSLNAFLAKALKNIETLYSEAAITHISRPLSDFHESFSHVFSFATQHETFAYKPKDLSSNLIIFHILEEFKKAYHSRLTVPETFMEGTCGIERYIPDGTCRAADFAVLFESLGHLIGLFFVLRGTDLNTENIKFSEGNLYLLDSETILTPLTTYELEWTKEFDSWSVLDSGIFVGVDSDVSRLWQVNPSILRTDSIKAFERKYLPIDGSTVAEPRYFQAEIIKGFKDFTEFSLKRTNFIIDVVSQYKHASFRFLLRQTKAYFQIIEKFRRPFILGGYDEYTQASLRLLLHEEDNRNHFAAQESKQLTLLNIPRISHSAAAKIFMIEGEMVPGAHILQSGFDSFKHHARGLTTDDILVQAGLLKRKFAMLR
jgi:lantibiotic modifying enzyme